MASDKQIEANRINSQKCCGPTSAAGLATSSQNALKSGIYSKAEVSRNESREEYQALADAFHARFAPAAPEEVCQVDDLIRQEWLSRRYMRADTALWEKSFENSKGIHAGQVFQYHSGDFTRAGRLYAASRRGFNSTLKELRRTQAERMNAQPAVAVAPATEPRLEEAAVQPPEQTQTEELTPELVSFPTFAAPADTDTTQSPNSTENKLETPATNPEKEEEPPIAA